MTTSERKRQLEKFRKEFCHRTKAARTLAGFTQEEMANLLGISREVYQKYETRSCLPHDLLTPFTRATGADLYVLMTGERRRDKT